MRFGRPIIAAAALAASSVQAQVPPKPTADQAAMLRSDDPKLAANKKLVYDMWREIVEAGQRNRVPFYFTPEYIQHNPNIASGRDNFVRFLKSSRPERPVKPTITFPAIALVAEGYYVILTNVRYYPDPAAPGRRYATTWFDMYRIEHGKIAEHWDAALKDAGSLHLDPNLDVHGAGN